MSKPIKDALPGSDAPVLRSDLLAHIYGLNADYLELLSAEHALRGHAAQLQYFAPKLQPNFAALSLDARLHISRVPFTLYSLCLHDVRFWQSVREAGAQTVERRYISQADGWLQGAFCEVALIRAWQMVLSNPLAARFLYAIEDGVARLLAAMPLWQIKRIAGEHPGLLLPRWPGNPGFWPDLLEFAASGDFSRLATTKLLGSQLMAAELGVCTERSTTLPARLRCTRREAVLRSLAGTQLRGR